MTEPAELRLHQEVAGVNRFTDHDPTALPQDDPSPPTLQRLLRQLGLDESEPEARAAVERWLGDHQPSAVLRSQLRRRGWATASYLCGDCGHTDRGPVAELVARMTAHWRLHHD